MHIHFEKSINAQTDCTILSMSWMGKVPDELPEDEGWKLNRNHYYQEGWLATGNIRGILGVTYTTSHLKRCSSPADIPQRSNYNLRGHRSQVTLVQWNEPYQKLASCDSSGIIFVWIKFEGRWSIELINDRSTPVTHFSWSHDGRMALICYQDGFVLVGSVAGQRYWSTGLNLDGTITCGIWTPDDQQVYFGTSNGQVIVMDVHGTMLSQVQLPSDSPIASMSWSCEKFKMEESEEGEASHYSNKRPFVLAVCFTTGGIYLMKDYDDVAPAYIFTGMHGLHMEWSNSGEFLAISGSRPVEVQNEVGVKVKEYANYLHIYNSHGVRILNLTVPFKQSPITAVTWGHNDKRIFVATGKVIHVGWVSKRIASLQLLCRLTIYKSLSTETCVSHLPLPLPVRALISSLHTQTILSMLPNTRDVREFVCHPPAGNLRLHCTMIRHEDDSSQSGGTVYTLYVEYLGGLVPILKGKRTSKIRPEFVIFDPQLCNTSYSGTTLEGGVIGNSIHGGINPNGESASGGESNTGQGVPHPISTSTSTSAASTNRHSSTLGLGYSDSSESDDVELCASPRMQRKRYRNRQRERERQLMREREREWERTRSSVHLNPEPAAPEQLMYSDTLPESVRLVEVTSNIWGTKFKIHGLASALPENMGSITYKTSLLHLQPRQMTLLITELRDDIFLSPANTEHGDENEEDFSVIVGNDAIHHHQYSGIGGGTGGEVYHGHHVIYHPQGAGSPIIPSNRCFLQPRGSGSSSGSNNNNAALTSIENQLISSQFGQSQNTTRVPFPSSPLPLVNNPCESYSDDDGDQDEFPYVDLTANPDMVKLREALRQSLQHEYDRIASLNEPTSTTKITTSTTSSIVNPVQIPVCESCDSSSSTPIPIRRRSSIVIEDSCTTVSTTTTTTVIDLQERHNSLQKLKSNLISRAQIQGNESGAVPSPSQQQSPPPSLHRTSGSIRSPTRICWSTTNTNVTTNPASSPPVIRPAHVRRSMSASYLDSVDHQVQFSLDIVNNDQSSPPKRLVLIKKKRDGEGKLLNGKPRLGDCGKSKSWDSCDINWWKKNSKELTTKNNPPCPKCNFPTVSKCNAIVPPTTPAKPKPPSTPAVSNASATTSSVRVPPPTPARRRSSSARPSQESIEDRIENAPTPPTPMRATPSTHRRSLSLLTPLLRRRDLNSRQQKDVNKEGPTTTTGTGGGGNPASSSFIPPGSPQHQPRSSPSTPATQRRAKNKPSYLSSASSPFRQLFANSPLLSRRRNKKPSQASGKSIIDSSDDEHTEDTTTTTLGRSSRNDSNDSSSTQHSHSPRSSLASINTPFRDLETFQKQQLRQKLRKKKIHNLENCPFPRRREFLMHNKAPMWNENSQVYQLDFGGRVTQESAKNFQIEFRGKQVMQFGRIDGNAYTLDFQYPFSALQAFSVALANVTQRLK